MSPSSTIARCGEDELIRRLGRRLGPLSPPSPVGLGDDAARLNLRRDRALLWSTDLLLEGVHFRREQAPARLLGRKILAVNASDLGAMGAVPRAFLLGLSLPRSLPLAWFDGFVGGLVQVARELEVACSGGDTCGSAERITLSLALVGEAPAHRLLTRSAARPGDGLWISGPLGASSVGLRLLQSGWRALGRSAVHRRTVTAGERRMAGRALRAHLDPRPPLSLGPWLLGQRISRAAIDLSDGLSIDLERLCRASGVGALVDAAAVPVAAPAAFWEARRGVDPLEAALHGGEEYALLFTVPRACEARMAGLPTALGAPVRIGEIVAGTGIGLRRPGGRIRQLNPRGFRHFGRSR